MTTKLLRVAALTKSFGDHQVLHDIHLDVAPGEFLTLLGPSGCGKTTLLRILAGFDRPDDGRVWLRDRDITQLPPERRPFNMVFQSYALFPHMTVGQNIAYGLRMRGAPHSEVESSVSRMLETVDLATFANRSPQALSGGQQQRVALARALINAPDVLLLDEPLGALDLKLRRQLQGELRSIRRHVDSAFVYVTHDQEEALSLSDRIALLDAGKVVQIGDPRSVYARPNSRFAAEFLGDSNFLPCSVVQVDLATQTAVARLDEGTLVTLSFAAGVVAQPGARACCSVRPEHLRIITGEADDVLTARLVESVFMGTHVAHTAVLPHGQPVRFRTTPGVERLPETVRLAIQEGCGVMIPAKAKQEALL